MALPPLVRYATVAEYRSHYDRVYCRGNILTFDGIRVYFAASKFGHVFYESTARDDRKDVFSPKLTTASARSGARRLGPRLHAWRY